VENDHDRRTPSCDVTHRGEVRPQYGERDRSAATIGATSPFVGLSGTVWGITNSFIGISRSRSTSGRAEVAAAKLILPQRSDALKIQ
jgi:biopolymer transport protein ExbB/TolQ